MRLTPIRALRQAFEDDPTLVRRTVMPAIVGTLAFLGVFLLLVGAYAWQTSREAAVSRTVAKQDAAFLDYSKPTNPLDSVAPAPVDESAEPAETRPETELIAFYANFDNHGYKILEDNIDKIDVLMPMWYHLDSKGRITVDDPKHQARVMRLIKSRRPDLKVMPIVNNYDKSTESWNAPQVSKMLKKESKRRAIAAAIVKRMKADGFQGVNIDFESFTEKDRGNIVKFMAELYPRAKAANLTVSQDVIVGSKTYNHRALARHVDYLIPMMYDEHWKTSGPGPISSLPWFETTLKKFVQQVPANKVVVGLGVYSYDLGKSGRRASSLTHADAIHLARQYRKAIKLDRTSLNLHFKYRKGGITRNVWMLDATSAFNQINAADKLKVRGYAVWRLGAEDPALWDVLPNRGNLGAEAAKSLRDGGDHVKYDEASGYITQKRIKP